MKFRVMTSSSLEHHRFIPRRNFSVSLFRTLSRISLTHSLLRNVSNLFYVPLPLSPLLIGTNFWSQDIMARRVRIL